METWIEKMNHLEWLFMQEIVLYRNVSSPKLKSLTVKNTVHSYNIICPDLQELTIDRFTKDNLKILKSYPRLECLRILESVDWKQMEKIDSPNLKSKDWHCFDIPEKENLILQLNDDCLHHLKKYLPRVDWISLQLTHPIFQHIHVQYYYIDDKTLKKLPLNENLEYYKVVLSSVSRLVLHEVLPSDICKIMEMCNSLNDLSVSFYDIDNGGDCYITHIPAGLKKLSLSVDLSSKIPDPIIFTDMFRRLNPTLTALDVTNTFERDDEEMTPDFLKCPGLKELHNIQNLKMSTFTLTKDFVEFLTQNKENIRDLDLIVEHDADPAQEKDLWRVIGSMGNLKKLTISGNVVLPVLPEGCLPSLETLTVSSISLGDLKTLFASIDGLKLRDLSYDGFAIDLADVSWKRMVNIEDLSLMNNDDDGTCRNLMPAVLTMKKLKKLFIYGLHDIDQISPLLRGLPELDKLTTRYENQSYQNFERARSYLRPTKRTFLTEDQLNFFIRFD